jgi:hypothetical protein
VQALISKIFAFGVDAGLLGVNPCHRLAKRGVENRCRRVLTDIRCNRWLQGSLADYGEWAYGQVEWRVFVDALFDRRENIHAALSPMGR